MTVRRDITVPIFLSADNNYAPFVATTIASICDNTKSFCEFYILDGGITKENQEKICVMKKHFSNFSIEFIKIDLEKWFANMNCVNQGDWISVSTYNRFLIPQLKQNIDRAIYSDVDVIVLGDIAEMYNEDLEGYALGAVWEEFAEDSINLNRKINLDLENNHRYFSAGNLLLDCKKWREDNITEKLFEIEKIYRNKLKYGDMDVLNKYFGNNYKRISFKYCFLEAYYEYYNTSDIVIRHFSGQIKPWHVKKTCDESLFKGLGAFWKYVEMTEFCDMLKEALNDEGEQAKILRRLQIGRIIANSKNKIKTQGIC